MSGKNPKVDGYLRANKKWRNELKALRAILRDSPLTEEVKWRHPCYTFQDGNVVILGAFKEYCAMTFFKGALLKDTQGVLCKPGENTQAARVIRFTDVQQIEEMASTLKSYINQSIANEMAGLKVELKKITERKVPEELQTQLDAKPSLKAAFHALTPGRQRAYLHYVSAAKQSTTRKSRVEKCIPQILKGNGLDE